MDPWGQLETAGTTPKLLQEVITPTPPMTLFGWRGLELSTLLQEPLQL